MEEDEQGGVREYWLLDPLRRQAEFNTLGEDGAHHLQTPGEGNIFRSRALPGLWLKVEWLFQDPQPPILGVLKEWEFV